MYKTVFFLSRIRGSLSLPLSLSVSVRVSHRLVGLVVKASTSRAEDPEFESRLRRDFFGVESYQ